MKVTWLVATLVVVVLAVTECRPVDQNKARKGVEKQMKQLKKLKCKPRQQKLVVKDVLSADNDVKDADFWPQVVVVKRCDDSCSYCGDDIGVETKRCVPSKTKTKMFYLAQYDDQGNRHYTHFKTQEHLRCSCTTATADNSANNTANTADNSADTTLREDHE